MTDSWFDEYTYQIVVNRKYLPKEVLEAYEQRADRVESPGIRWDLWHKEKTQVAFLPGKDIAGAKAPVREKSAFGEKSPGRFFVAGRRSF